MDARRWSAAEAKRARLASAEPTQDAQDMSHSAIDEEIQAAAWSQRINCVTASRTEGFGWIR